MSIRREIEEGADRELELLAEAYNRGDLSDAEFRRQEREIIREARWEIEEARERAMEEFDAYW